MSGAFVDLQTESVAMDYSEFAPRLYNLCKQFGLRREHMLPVSAFCSDEDQGYPLLILTKHFGTIPVDIGAANGWINYTEIPIEQDADLVIVQSNHVGGAPPSKVHGGGQISEATNEEQASACRYQSEILRWYQNEYQFAKNGISLKKEDGRYLLIIDNQLLDEGRGEGLFLNMDKMVQRDAAGNHIVVKQYSTAKAFASSEDFVYRTTETNLQEDGARPIGRHLNSDLFYFKQNKKGTSEEEWSRAHELNVLMPKIITSPWPAQSLSQARIQIEFEHNFRAIIKEKKYRRKNLVYIAGVHQDAIQVGKRAFNPTLFVPWAAYIQQSNGRDVILEQLDLVEHLSRYSVSNPVEINLEVALREMERRGHLRVIDCDTPEH